MPSRLIVLDSGPLGLLCNPKKTKVAEAAQRWLQSVYDMGVRVVVPEIADYEIRRELIRGGRSLSVLRLNRLKELLEYAPLTTAVMHQAAAFWAEARNTGRPTAPDPALDTDAILAAQALAVAQPDDDLVVATLNVGHVSRYVPARVWHEIS